MGKGTAHPLAATGSQAWFCRSCLSSLLGSLVMLQSYLSPGPAVTASHAGNQRLGRLSRMALHRLAWALSSEHPVHI